LSWTLHHLKHGQNFHQCVDTNDLHHTLESNENRTGELQNEDLDNDVVVIESPENMNILDDSVASDVLSLTESAESTHVATHASIHNSHSQEIDSDSDVEVIEVSESHECNEINLEIEKNMAYNCQLCQVTCTGRESYDAHMKGQKHKKQMDKVRLKEEVELMRKSMCQLKKNKNQNTEGASATVRHTMLRNNLI
jgi:hypothetical protein